MLVGYDVTHPDGTSALGWASMLPASSDWWQVSTRISQPGRLSHGTTAQGRRSSVGELIFHFREPPGHVAEATTRDGRRRTSSSSATVSPKVKFKMVLDREVQYHPPSMRPEIRQREEAAPDSYRFCQAAPNSASTLTDPDHIHHRSKSLKEGTVVDRGVTNVRYWDPLPPGSRLASR